MEASAKLTNVRVSSKRIQPIAKMVRGVSLQEALARLHHNNTKGARLISKVIESARSNAHEKEIDIDTLKVKTITVDRGPIMYRMLPRQRGMAHRLEKPTSHITVVVGDE